MSKEKKNNSEMKKKVKKVVGGLLAAVLLVGGAILGTLAFLKTMSDTKTNTFTASQDIKLGLDEPNYNEKVWDSDLDDTNNGGDGDGTEDPNEMVLKYPDRPDPSKYIPAQEYLKDPTLYNLTGGNEGAEEWVAMRVDYTIGNQGNNKVTYTQLTHSCDNSDGKVAAFGVQNPVECYQWSSTDENTREKNHICSYKSQISSGTGIIELIDFDADEYKNSSWTNGHSWIRLTPKQIDALIAEELDLTTDLLNNTSDDKKYDIFVYKYKLTEKENVNTIEDAKNDTKFLEATGSALNNDEVGGKTTPLFDSITTKDKTQLGINGYVDGTDTLTAPPFEIILKGAAAKDDDTVSETIISATDIDNTIDDYVEFNANTDPDKVAVTETDSYKIVKELVQLLASAS